MSEETTERSIESMPPVRRRTLFRLFLGFCLFSFVAFSLLAWYVTTESFQRRVRRRVIASAEKMTGGRVELGELHTTPFRLRVDARNLVIHGREGGDEAPFLRVDRVQAEMKIISLLSTTVGLHSLMLEHPVIHLIDYPDGTTNAPIPPESRVTGEGPLEELISLSVSRIEVQRGEVLWQDKKVPFEFAGQDLALLLNYSLLHRQYEAHLSAGSVATRIQNLRPFVWRADASVVLGRGRIDISTLNVFTGKTDIHFVGHLQDFHNPQISGDYRGVADLGELAALLRQPQFRKGAVQFEGRGSWTLETFATQGDVQSKDIEWSNGKLGIRGGRLAASFSVTPSRFRVWSIKANAMGGDLSGDADVTNWQSALESMPRNKKTIGKVAPGSLQRGSLRLQVSGFPLAPALTVLASKNIPLDRLNFSGNASGTMEALWVGSITDAETKLNLEISPPLKPVPGEIPLRGKIDGVYRGSRDEVDLVQARLSTAGTEFTATGSLATDSSLRFSFSSHNLKEWTPFLEAEFANSSLPFAVHGWAGLSGSATGRLTDLSVSANLEVYDFDTTVPLRDHRETRTIHWDALSSGLRFSGNHFAVHNGSAIHGHTVAHFDASALLGSNGIAQNAPFTLHVEVHEADVSEVAQLAGVAQPLAGTMDMSATLSGTPAAPHGDGHLNIHNGSIYGLMVPRFSSDLRLADGEIQASNIETGTYGAELSGSAAIEISDQELAKKRLRVNLTGRNIDLAKLPHSKTQIFTATGVADFTMHGSGTLDQPSLDAHIHIKDLAFDADQTGNFYLDAVTRGDQLDIRAHSDFKQAEVQVSGSVQLDHDFPADLALTFRHFDSDAFFGNYLQGKITGHAPIDGMVQVRGSLRRPRDLKATAELQSFSAEFGHIAIQSIGPVRLEVENQTVRLEELHLAGSGTDFTAHGSIHLGGSREIDLQLGGAVNMTLLQSLNPKVLARGTLGLNLNTGGTVSQPVLQGRLEVKNTFVSHNDFPSGLSDLNGVLLFDRNRFQIESMKGTTGGGSVMLTGSATYQDGLFQLDFGATAHDVRLRYPPGVSSTANAELQLTGNTNSALLSGNVVVTKLAVTPGFDFGAYIEKSKQSVVLTQSDSLESRLKLDVHVVTTPELQMQTAIARLSGDADLRVRGTADRPAILGRVEVLEGEIAFNGTKYKLERGDVTFANPAKTQPILDMTATTRVRDYDITVQFRGDASATNGLKVTWQSEPQLPEADVIALLALGRTREESAAVSSSGSFGFGGEASNLLINEALNSTVNSRLQRLFGASRVKIDPQGLASETNVVRGPQVTIEQQVASNLTLTYSTNVSVSTQQIIQVEYNVSRNISIVALRDQNGVVSFDFRIRRHRK